MKVCFTSDLHGDIRILKTIKKVDLLVICGDLFGDIKERELLSEVNSLPFPVLVMPGNHDNWFQRNDISEFTNIKLVLEDIVNLQEYNRNAKVDLVVFSYIYKSIAKEHWAYILKDEEYTKRLNNLMRRVKRDAFFVGHYGPIGKTNFREWNGYNYGLQDINDIMENEHIVGVIHGHLHDNAGMVDDQDGKKVYNVAKQLLYLNL